MQSGIHRFRERFWATGPAAANTAVRLRSMRRHDFSMRTAGTPMQQLNAIIIKTYLQSVSNVTLTLRNRRFDILHALQEILESVRHCNTRIRRANSSSTGNL